MGTLNGEARAVVTVKPDAAFSTVTDLGRLPAWNSVMTRVVECPKHLEPGAQWVAEFHVLGRTWRSRSTCELIDAGARRFGYRTQTDDGNPSYATWQWDVEEADGGSMVTVRFELHPMTFWRRVLLGRIRARQLIRDELPASLAALGRASAVGPG